MVRRTREAVGFRAVALIPLLLVVFGAVLSCTDILGIDTDYGANPCNTEKASGLAPIECHQGACHALIDACDNLGLPASCPAFEPQEKDLCNDGFDNDCDGYTDEDECPCEELDEAGKPNWKSCYTGSPATRAVGACQDGIQYCQNGVWNQCTEAVLPNREICDNLDNDCDGSVDEGCTCNNGQQQPCYRGPASTLGVGECKSGTQTCSDGAWGNCFNDVSPKLEVCDGKDNDCNGDIDIDSDSCDCVEGDQEDCYTGPPNTLNEGVCTGGLRTCVGGKYNDTDECTGEVVPSAEICDGLDNDCNGLVDEGIPDIGLPCVSDLPGDCTAGTYICTTEDGLFCQPGVLPGEHYDDCNTEDDDCDGVIDDGPYCCALDTVRSGNETDVNCGGSCATKCQLNQNCLIDADCESNSCNGTTCVPPECDDGSINGGETDVDCGGISGCPPCPVGDLCIVDGDCITDRCEEINGFYQCAPKGSGEPCGSGGECQSGFCVDQVCCNTQCAGLCQACTQQKKGNGGADGICEAIADGADPDSECSVESPTTCGSEGVCSGFGSCRLYPASQICSPPSCAGQNASNPADYCNGLGVCVNAVAVSCGTYGCNMPTGICNTTCSSDAQCASDAYCTINGTCVAKLPTGQFCSTANECLSGHCVDGYCCGSACSNACDVCAASLGAAANGTCTIVAGYAGNPSCNGFLCTAAQPSCPSTCANNAGCAATHYCDANSACAMKLPTGQGCASASQCQSGHCVDGYCCNTACGGACDVCAASLGASTNGTCTNSATYGGSPSCGNYICSGASPNCPLSCSNDSVCATGRYCSSTTNTCIDKLVTGSACQNANQCDSGYCVDGFCCGSACSNPCDVCSQALGASSNGACTNAAGYVNPACGGLACTGTSSLCPNACSTDAQCISGYYCNSANNCVPKQIIGASCSAPNQCASGFCADGVCCNDACNGSCNVCAASLGASSDGTCTNILGPGSPSCAPFTCTGTTNVCPAVCSGDSQCVAGRYCSGGDCVPKQADGAICSANNQCNSNFCIDGVCCGTQCSGPCNVCAVVLGAAQDGVCANVTGFAGSPSCAPYVCSSATAACPITCSTDGQCVSGYYCNSPTCEPKRSNGQSCSTANQCLSGNCVDGVCCDTFCGGGDTNDCQACNNAASLGTCNASPSGSVCRAASGACDVAETCNGVSFTCPADGVAGSATVCRASAGLCDVPESCDGSGKACPGDVLASSSTVCRASADLCDVAENCTGSSANCPPDIFATAGTPCRAMTDLCDVAENCTGAAATCPADAAAAAGTPCRASTDDCDPADTCSGGGVKTCTNTVLPDGAVCGGYVCGSGACLDGNGSPPNDCISDMQCPPGSYCDSTGACARSTVLILGGSSLGMLTASYYPGGTWSAQAVPAATQDTTRTTSGVAVTLSRSGGVGLVRHTGTTNPDQLRDIRWSVASGWSAFAPLAAGVTTTEKPDITSLDSAVHAVYWATSHYRYAAFAGGTWSPTGEVTTSDTSNAHPADLAVLLNGNPVAAYRSANAPTTSFSRIERTAPGVWTSPSTIVTYDNIFSALPPSIVVLSNGDPMVVFHDNFYLYWTRYSAGLWSAPVQIGNNSYSSNEQIALTALPGGQAALAYRSMASGTAGRIFTSFFNGTSWSLPAQYGASSLDITGPPAIAAGAGAGTPNAAVVEIAYVRTNDEQIYHLRCSTFNADGCTAMSGSPVMVENTLNMAFVAITSSP